MISPRILLLFLLVAAPPMAAQQTPPFVRGPAGMPASDLPGAKSPTAARLIGLVPGAGHVYAGEVRRGFGYLGSTLGLFALSAMITVGDCLSHYSAGTDCGDDPMATVAAFAGVGVWGWSIHDAGRAARRTNARRRGGLSLITHPVGVSIAARRDRPGVELGLTFVTR